MQRSIKLLLGAAVIAAAPSLMGLRPVAADPAFNPDQAADILLKQQAAIAAYKAKIKTRGVCIGKSEDCPSPKPPEITPVALPTINFAFDSRIPLDTHDNRNNLNQIVSMLTSPGMKETFKFEIMGHTDAVGDAEYNLQLSQARAETIVDILQHKGVSVSLIPHGYGKQHLLKDVPPDSEKNRRVEVESVMETSQR